MNIYNDFESGFIYQDNLIINIHQCIVILIIDTSMLIIDRMNILFSNKMKPKFLQTYDPISKRISQKTTKIGCCNETTIYIAFIIFS